MRTGQADLPLHTGRAPGWLFERMVSLARAMTLAIVEDAGPRAVLDRLSDPVWFQAFGCALGFDWHSSGLTTTVCGALKLALANCGEEAGIAVCGGKGAASRHTPAEIERACERWGLEAAPLVEASRMSAKVDSSALQDGFQVYHHTFLFLPDGTWSVIQQGMNGSSGWARRYHWMTPPAFDCDPHAAVTSPAPGRVLNLVAAEAAANRATSAALACEPPRRVAGEIRRMRELRLPARHAVMLGDLDPDRIERVLLSAYEHQPRSFSELLGVRGLGAKGLRALALVAELVYGDPVSVRDPASYSFAHGGKDGTPYPVDRPTYDATIGSLERTLAEARLGRTERRDAMARLAAMRAAGGSRISRGGPGRRARPPTQRRG